MSCCSEYVTIGCVDACDTISLGYNADATGTHYIEVQLSQGAVQSEATSYTSGSDMTIPADLINENSQLDIRIKKPDGTYYAFDTGVTCARLITQLHYSLGIVT